jgi:hypothetical protein
MMLYEYEKLERKWPWLLLRYCYRILPETNTFHKDNGTDLEGSGHGVNKPWNLPEGTEENHKKAPSG